MTFIGLSFINRPMRYLHSSRAIRAIVCTAALWFGAACAFAASDFTVATPGGQFSFNINGTNSPTTITLVRGRLYEFSINTSNNHPFQIMSNTTLLNAARGVTNNGIFSGTMFFRVPTNANNYSYRCGVHTGTAALQGTIATVAPPAPPLPPIIRSFDFTTNLVLRSTATNVTFFPEFKTNLNDTNWVLLVVQTNRLINGQMETICGRPAATNVFIRIRAVAP